LNFIFEPKSLTLNLIFYAVLLNTQDSWQQSPLVWCSALPISRVLILTQQEGGGDSNYAIQCMLGLLGTRLLLDSISGLAALVTEVPLLLVHGHCSMKRGVGCGAG
jgi:hypothetical protein